MGDVGDGDDEAEAGAVGFGVDGVVEVAGVFAVDGDEGRVAEVFAISEGDGSGGFGFGDGGLGEDGGDVVGVDADQ